MVIDSNRHYFRLKSIATDFVRFFFPPVLIDTNLFFLVLQIITGDSDFNILSIHINPRRLSHRSQREQRRRNLNELESE